MQRSNVILTVTQEFLVAFLNSENSLYVNYHRLISAQQRIPAQQNNHTRRVESDNVVFGAYMDQICCCALSLTSTGAWGYGSYHLTLKIEMIESPLAFTQYNTYHYQKWFDELVHSDGHKYWHEKPGFRAEWSRRAQLAVAKHAGDLRVNPRRADFGGILLKSTGTRAEEDFIEGHIYGPLSREAISMVRAPTDAEFRRLCGGIDLKTSRGLRKSISRKVDGLKLRDGLSIDFKCGD
jgi:hypothetical protein